MQKRLITHIALGVIAAGASVASAGTRTYTFDEFTQGLIVTDNLEGVSFASEPATCFANPLFMRVQEASSSTVSGTQVLQIDQGCPEFSTTYLVMTFEQPQSNVSFYMGGGGDYDVRAYAQETGGAPLSTTTYATGSDIDTFVNVTSGTPNIRRIEVESPISNFEIIDDLTFEVDDTPPIVNISAPAPRTCACDITSIVGYSYDPDGTYLQDRLEYAADPNGPWTLIGSFASPLAEPGGTLYNWDTTSLTEGFYFLRFTATNTSGLSTQFVTDIYVSRDFDTATMSIPDPVRAVACINGSIADYCGATYSVQYRLADSIMDFEPIDPDAPTYSGGRSNETIANWNTTLLEDGMYEVLLQATNSCGHTASQMLTVQVDNTPPEAEITSPINCSRVEGGEVVITGTASDLNIASWQLRYSGGDTNGLVQIASGNSSITDDVLAVWDTSQLPACAYTIVLTVSDKAVNGCGSGGNGRSFYTTIDLGCEADYNRDGMDGIDDLLAFLGAWFEGCE